MARLSLQTRQTSGLIMTGALQQAIGLLQLSNQELLSELTLIAESNPLLVVSSPEDNTPEYDTAPEDYRSGDLPQDLDPEDPQIATDWDDDPLLRHSGNSAEEGLCQEPNAPPPGRIEVFLTQISRYFNRIEDRFIALALVEALDASGRLETSPCDIAKALDASVEHIEAVRRRMLFFEPVGCFALSLTECLATQFRARNRYDPAVATLLDHLDWLAHGEHDRLRKACGLDARDYADLLQELRGCEPRPGASFAPPDPDPEPDLFIHPGPDGPVISLNQATWPKLTLDEALYRRLLSGQEEARLYAREKHDEATTLLRAVEQRARSLLLICQAIARYQAEFLEKGITALKPLTLSQIAEKTGLHESTVSRVTTSRIIGTQRGLLPLRRFFSTGLGNGDEQTSADSVKARLKHLITEEKPDGILSDDALTRALQDEGHVIQRRTVAKYREALGIASSAQRRREFRLRAHLANATES